MRRQHLTSWYRVAKGSYRIGPTPSGSRGFVRRSDVRLGETTGKPAWLYGHRLDGAEVVLGVRDYFGEAKGAAGWVLTAYTDEALRALAPHADPDRRHERMMHACADSMF